MIKLIQVICLILSTLGLQNYNGNRLYNPYANGSHFSCDEMDMLYRIAWAEARGEDDKGIILVINVIINRLYDDGLFKDQRTLYDVLFAPNQFSPIRDGSFDRATPCARIKDAVHKALNGTDYSQGALFFNMTTIQHTSWAGRNRTWLFNHGTHSFYL